jgi:predicted regulator of amino acid metabolism with ACT domain
MIAAVTAALAEARVNIDDMRVGHDPDGAAAMQVLATTPEVPEAVRDALRTVDGIVSVHALTD